MTCSVLGWAGFAAGAVLGYEVGSLARHHAHVDRVASRIGHGNAGRDEELNANKSARAARGVGRRSGGKGEPLGGSGADRRCDYGADEPPLPSGNGIFIRRPLLVGRSRRRG